MNNKKHYAAAITAFLIWGFFSLPLRAIKEYPAGDILYFRMLFSFGLLAFIITAFKRKDFVADLSKLKAIDRKKRMGIIALIFGGGAILTVNWLTFIYVVNNINVKTASFSYLICPVFTAILGFILLNEKMSTLQWIAVILCAFSCVLIGMSSALELGFSFLTAFTYALYLVSQRKLQGFDRMVVLGVQITFVLFLLTLAGGVLIESVPTDISFYGFIFIIAALFTVIPLFLNLFALNRINSATIGILMYINPLINFTLAFVVFGEKIDTLQLIGYGIIAVALVVFNLENFGKIRAMKSNS